MQIDKFFEQFFYVICLIVSIIRHKIIHFYRFLKVDGNLSFFRLLHTSFKLYQSHEWRELAQYRCHIYLAFEPNT